MKCKDILVITNLLLTFICVREQCSQIAYKQNIILERSDLECEWAKRETRTEKKKRGYESKDAT